MNFRDIYASGYYRSRFYFSRRSSHEKYFHTTSIHFYGIPETLTDAETERIYNGESGRSVFIGEVTGTLVLGKQLADDGLDVLAECGEVSGDLLYTVSALINAGILEPELYLFADIFYIHEYEPEPDYDDPDLNARVIGTLPDVMLSMFNVKPSILAYYPLPLEKSDDDPSAPKHEVAVAVPPSILDDPDDPGRIMHMKISDNELDTLLETHGLPAPYPSVFKDPRLWQLYTSVGYREAGQSRLLFMRTDGL